MHLHLVVLEALSQYPLIPIFSFLEWKSRSFSLKAIASLIAIAAEALRKQS
jgi:prepilin signal peptidase PulO-like enzyme (type II secretory pathway)